MKKTLITLLLALGGSIAHSATVNWAAGIDTGFADNSGIALPIGNLLQLGYFSVSDAQVLANGLTKATLLSEWVPIASTTVGTTFNIPAAFQTASTPNLGAADFGHQIYIWAVNATTVASATQQAIFYEPISGNGNWAFPGSNLATTTIDINQAKTGTFLAGSYQSSNASVTAAFGTPAGAIKLAPIVPEPSTLALCALSGLAMIGSRRRVRK